MFDLKSKSIDPSLSIGFCKSIFERFDDAGQGRFDNNFDIVGYTELFLQCFAAFNGRQVKQYKRLERKEVDGKSIVETIDVTVDRVEWTDNALSKIVAAVESRIDYLVDNGCKAPVESAFSRVYELVSMFVRKNNGYQYLDSVQKLLALKDAAGVLRQARAAAKAAASNRGEIYVSPEDLLDAFKQARREFFELGDVADRRRFKTLVVRQVCLLDFSLYDRVGCLRQALEFISRGENNVFVKRGIDAAIYELEDYLR